MSIASGLVVFLIAWWLVFFLLLPMGVQSHNEAGEDVVPGTHESAPVKPRLWTKAGVATLAAGAIWYGVYLVVTSGILHIEPVS